MASPRPASPHTASKARVLVQFEIHRAINGNPKTTAINLGKFSNALMLLSSPSSVTPPGISKLWAILEHNLDEIVRNGLKHERDVFFVSLIISTGVVVVGLLLEEAKLWFPAGKPQLDRINCVFPPSPLIKWRRRIEILGWILIVGGVIGEGVFEGATSIADGLLQDFSNVLLSDALRQAGSAAESAKTAHEEADATRKETDKLTERLAAASRQLDTTEQNVLAQGPRWKALEHGKTEFIAALKPFPGQHLTVVICGQDDSDRFPFEQTLMKLVHESGWAAPESRRWQGCPTSLTGGNEIFAVSSVDLWQHAVSPSCAYDAGRQGASAAAEALCDALNKLRINTTAWILAPANQTAFPKESPPVSQLSVAVWARGFFGFGTPDSPAELAVQEPAKIFILVGSR
jgi:hypothetical protein